MPLSIPGGFGTSIPRRRLHFSIPRRKRYTISAQNSAHEAFRAGWAPPSRAGGYIFPFRAEKDTPFPRRTVARDIPGRLGTPIPRRRLHFSIPRRKRYPIPARNFILEQSRRVTATDSRAESCQNGSIGRLVGILNRLAEISVSTLHKKRRKNEQLQSTERAGKRT